MTLTEFLLARIAEDEAVARDGDRSPFIIAGRRAGKASAMTYWRRFDPARVLAECAAKREIVAEAVRAEVEFSARDYTQVSLTWPHRTALRLLATVYADHPDFDGAWRP